MNFRQLEGFRAVMQAGSVTEACLILGRSQPAISRAIADLEADIGYKLFARVNRRMVPTEEGLRLFDEVERAFTGLERLREAASEIGGQRRAQLRIVAMPAISFSLMPAAIEELVRRNPDLRVSFEVRSSAWVCQAVATRQADVGVTALFFDQPGLDIAFTIDVPCVCLLPRGHRLASRRLIRAEDLADEPFISLGPQFRTRRLIDDVFDRLAVPRRVQVETQLSQSLCALVARGLGVAVIEPFTPRLWPQDSFELRPFLPEVRFACGMVTPAQRPPSPPAQEFLDILASVIRSQRAPGLSIQSGCAA